jgi:phage-related protein
MILLDGQPLEYYGLRLLKGHSHPSPDINNKTVKVPGRPGFYHFGNEIGARPFSHPVGVLESNVIETQKKIRAFNSLLFDGYGQVREIKLEYTYETDKYYTVVFDGSIDPQRIFEYAEFNLPLVANNPFAQASVTNNEINWDSKIITMDDSYAWGTTAIDQVEVTKNIVLETFVNGLSVRPTILINGTGQNVTFRCNGKSFSLKNFTNSEFEINGQQYTVLKNGVNGFSEKIGIDFIELLPGVNEIEVTGIMDFTLSVIYRDQYM